MEQAETDRSALIHSERPSELADAAYPRCRRPPVVRGFAVPQTPLARMVAEAGRSDANNHHAAIAAARPPLYRPVQGVGFVPPKHVWGGPPKPPPPL